jgi:hypothetical protein
MYIFQELTDKIKWLKNNHKKDYVVLVKGIFLGLQC